jgi:uncharacterized membrane protein YjgN (DUF898 family)
LEKSFQDAATRNTARPSVTTRTTAAPATPSAGAGPPASATAGAAERTVARAFRFDGLAGELFVIYVKNVVFTLLTLGIYRFWAKVALRRYLYQHTSFYGSRFDYHATGKERFLGFLKGLLFLSPLIGTLVLVYFLITGQGVDEEAALTLTFYLFLLVMFFLRPLILVGSNRYHLSRTSWSGMRFRFDGRASEAYGIYIVDGVLMVLTLGLYWSWHHVKVRRFRAQHSLVGGERMDFHGTGLEFLGITIGGTMLTYITLGLFAPWYIAMVNRFNIDNLSFQGKRFRSSLRGWEVLKLIVVGVVATVCTLGLAFPWVMSKYHQLFTDSMSFLGEVDLDALRGSYDARASALADGLAEAGDALESLGEILGG